MMSSVKYFMNTTDCTVFLLSLKAGGVALNLTEASRVFIMDPWWNPSAEVQAMDRIVSTDSTRQFRLLELMPSSFSAPDRSTSTRPGQTAHH